jgi:hypothetical protein
MNRMEKHSQPDNAVSEPAYLKLHRVFFATCLLLAPLATSLWFGLCPTGANDAGCPDGGRTPGVYLDFHVMNPQLMQVFLLLSLMIPFVYPLSYLALGRLAMKRSPWLSTFGITLGWMGSIPWGLFAAQMVFLNIMAQLGPTSLFETIENRFYTTGIITVFAACWVIGHQFAYVLLGIALLRARAIPLWAALLLVVSEPIMGPIAYGTNLGLLQILGYLLVLVASIPAAVTMLKTRGRQEQALVPTVQELIPAS